MGDDFFDAFGDQIDADWSEVSEDKIDKLLKRLSDQDAERIFDELRDIIAKNNSRKGLIRVSLVVLQEAVKLGLKVTG